MRRVLIGYEFVHKSSYDTPAVFQVAPLPDQEVQLTEERWSTDPEQPTRHYNDIYGNPCLRLTIPAGRSVLTYEAVASVPDATEDFDEDAPEVMAGDLTDDVLLYTLPSRYCLPDVLGDEAWTRFGPLPPGYRRVPAICDYVNGHLTFPYGSSIPLTTAADVHASGYGVCRDFTHLAISLCRALSIPASYVFGYLPEIDVAKDPSPMDFADWMEVWLGDRWWTFDPRNNERRKGRVLIGRGRDASDVAMATTFGAPLLESMSVRAEEARCSRAWRRRCSTTPPSTHQRPAHHVPARAELHVRVRRAHHRAAAPARGAAAGASAGTGSATPSSGCARSGSSARCRSA